MFDAGSNGRSAARRLIEDARNTLNLCAAHTVRPHHACQQPKRVPSVLFFRVGASPSVFNEVWMSVANRDCYHLSQQRYFVLTNAMVHQISCVDLSNELFALENSLDGRKQIASDVWLVDVPQSANAKILS